MRRPDGFAKVTANEKYYRPFKEKKEYREALKKCLNLGATLVEFQSEIDFFAVQHMTGIVNITLESNTCVLIYILADFTVENRIWTGLINPNSSICNNDGCLNKLMWISDGSAYRANYNTYIDQGYQCMVMNHPDSEDWRAGDALCGRQRDFACEFRCDTGDHPCN